MIFDEDLALQLQLQEQVAAKKPSIMDLPDKPLVQKRKSPQGIENRDPERKQKTSLIDPSWEYIDPTPDVHAMFIQFNTRFFWGRLYSVEVRWSPRMTSCAGVCCYEGRGGLCSVRLSAPLLKLRPRKDLVETLLHEMIHAYLFVTNNDRDRDGHGPEFHKHMYRINKEAGTNITVYHNFHDEVKLYQQHWWRCNGPCQKWRPFYGMVKRAMNRPPGPTDFWWGTHEAKCGGIFKKVREPEGYVKKKNSQASLKVDGSSSKEKNDIRNFFPFMGEGKLLTVSTSGNSNEMQLDKKLNIGKESPGKVVPFNKSMVSSKNLTPKGVVQRGVIPGIPPKKNIPGNGHTGIRTFHNGNTYTNSSKNVPSNLKTHPVSKNNISTVSNLSGNSNGNSNHVKGMLANKGSGTLVITQKGNKQVPKTGDTRNDTEHGNSVAAAVKPFCGNGYTIGTKGSSQAKPPSAEKPWLSFLDKIEADCEKRKKRLSASVAGNYSSLTKSTAISKPTQNELAVHSPPKKLKLNSSGSYIPNDKNTSGNWNTQSSGSCSKRRSSSINDSVSAMVNCPTCGILVEETTINSHLDTCILSDSVESSGFRGLANCPICLKDFPASYITQHVDKCLSTEEEPISDLKDEVEQEMIQCPMCDKQLLKCLLDKHLELCIQCISNEDASFFEESECCSSEFDDNVNNSGDDLQPCPVCMKLVKESDMNIHLDKCLSADILDDMTER